ncbi:hypothetical protein [Streptomyces sp. NPDC094032]|uniref:hypothetical protein n=1 Tax=Streptomyces sp. NPDC094032 TaxID=3155308 RepID=UPI00332A3284
MALCAACGVEPRPEGYGLLVGREAGSGRRYALLHTDLELCSMVTTALRPEFLPGERIVLPETGMVQVPDGVEWDG